MYHDEFARKPAKPMQRGDDVQLPAGPLEFGGGLSLGLAASLNQPLSLFLLYLGGLLPLVACSLSIVAHRASELLARLAPALEAARPSAVPIPHLSTARVAAGRHRIAARSRSTR